MDFFLPPFKMTKNKAIQSYNDKNLFVPLPNDYNNDNMHYSCQIYTEKLLKNLNELRIKQSFCDVEIIIENKIFHAHRAILASSSLYFNAMFTGGLCEKNKYSIKLHGITTNIFEILLEFIYSGKMNIDQNNVQELMIAADMVGLNDIVVGCTDFLIRELLPLNAIGIYEFANNHNWTDLKIAAENYIENNFPKVSNEDEICELDKDEFIKLLKSENLKIDTEFQVFQTALRWINRDILERRQYVFDILKHVRLPLLPLGLLEQTITQCNDSSLKVALKSIHNDLLNRLGCFVSLNVQPRKCAKKDIYVIGGSKRELLTVWDRGSEVDYVPIEKFNTFTKEWIRVPDMTVNRLVPGVAALNGNIYVAGGEEDSSSLSSCERFDPQSNQWTQVESMVIPRCEFGLCALDGYLYAVGGWVDTDISGSIERYDPKTDKWRLVGNLPEPRFSMGLVSYEGLIYMVGGCSLNERNLHDLVSYNPSTGEWKQLASMSVARFQMGVSVLDDYLYVVGGTHRQQALKSVERYSFKTNKWTMVPNMNKERSGPAVAAMDGLLYVIGGAQTHATAFYRAQCTIASVECYDPLRNCWFICPPLSETRAEAGAVVI